MAPRFSLPGRTVLHGIALPLRLPSGHAEARLEIAADVDGRPVEGKPLATVDLVLDASDGGAAWYDALAATPIDTGDAAELWVVVKGKSGIAEWVAQSEPAPMPPATLYTNEGVRSADPSDDAPAALEFDLSADEVVTATPGGGAVVIAVTATAMATGTLVARSATAYFKT